MYVSSQTISRQLRAQTINALAYTFGNNIVFGTGQFSPTTNEGRHLIAHESTHVLQGGRGSFVKRSPSDEKSSGCSYEPGEVTRSRMVKKILPLDVANSEFFGLSLKPDTIVIADFAVNDSELKPPTKTELKTRWIGTFKRTDILRVKGYTDCSGSD